jgi:hypothetical protein
VGVFAEEQLIVQCRFAAVRLMWSGMATIEPTLEASGCFGKQLVDIFTMADVMDLEDPLDFIDFVNNPKPFRPQ